MKCSLYALYYCIPTFVAADMAYSDYSNSDWNELLNKNRSHLVKNIDITALYDYFCYRGIISEWNEVSIRNTGSEIFQKQRLLDRLLKRPVKDKLKFIEALQETNQQHIVEQYLTLHTKPDTKPTYLTREIIDKVSTNTRVQESWELLATTLGIDELTRRDIERIRRDDTRAFEMMVRDVLHEWQLQKPQEATLSNFIEALDNIGCLNLAHELEPDMDSFEEEADQHQSDSSSLNVPDHQEDIEMRKSLERALRDGKQKTYRARIMLVGHSGAGKTHLMKNFLGLVYNHDEDAETNGINTYITVYNAKQEDGFFKETTVDKEVMFSTSVKEYKRLQDSQVREEEDVSSDLVQEQLESNVVSSTAQAQILNPLQVPDKTMAMFRRCEDKEADFKELYSFWDFAGHEMFAVTHQTFLTNRCIYILVVNLLEIKSSDNRMNWDGVLDWLKSIHAYADRSMCREKCNKCNECTRLTPPVIIVGTHSDDAKFTNKVLKEINDALCELLVNKAVVQHVAWPLICISNNKMENIQKVQDRIIEVLEEQEYWGEDRPIGWLNMEITLRDKAKEKQRNYLEYSEVVQLAKESSPTGWEENEVKQFLKYQHLLGEFIYFDDIGDPNIVILDPQWLIDAFKAVITIDRHKSCKLKCEREWNYLDKKAILKEQLIKMVWKGDIYEIKEALLKIMEHFDLICLFKPTTGEEECQYIVPCKLQKLTVEDAIIPSSSKPTLYLVPEEDFLPDGLFFRLLSRCIKRWSCHTRGDGKMQIFRDVAVFLIDAATTSLLVLRKDDAISFHISKVRPEEEFSAKVFQDVLVFLTNSVSDIIRSFFPNARLQLKWEYKGCRYPIQNTSYPIPTIFPGCCIRDILLPKYFLADYESVSTQEYQIWFTDRNKDNNKEKSKSLEQVRGNMKDALPHSWIGLMKTPSNEVTVAGLHTGSCNSKDPLKTLMEDVLPYIGRMRSLSTLNKEKQVKITVAILDTGLRQSHDLFKGMQIESTRLMCNSNDDNFHGTACAGIVTQIAEFVTLVPMKVNLYTTASLIKALRYLLRWRDDDIVSISLGGWPYDADLDDVLKQLSPKMTIICAAGNSGNASRAIAYPANLKGEVICVGSCDRYGNRSPSSSGGANLSFLAPGDLPSASNEGDDKMFLFSGTSCAAPYAAAVAAHVLAKARLLGFTDDELKKLKRTRVMEAVLKKMCTTNSNNRSEVGSGFLQPHILLDDEEKFKVEVKAAFIHQP